jgi:SAM-dependent methyltransferase
MPDSQAIVSPDNSGTGLVDKPLDPLRYDGHTSNRYEVAGILQAMMPQNARVLDVGCGTGSVAIVANENKGNLVFGIEPDEVRAKVAASRGIQVTSGFLSEGFLMENGPFDVIVFSDVLEHLVSHDEMIRLAATGLKPNGVMLVSVPNVAHWSIRFNLLCGRFDYAKTGLCDSTHLRWFTRRTIQSLVTNRGFDILELRYAEGAGLPLYYGGFFRAFPHIWVSRAIRFLLKFAPTLFGAQIVLKVGKRKV